MKEVNQILLDLKRKIYKPIYFLCGEEPYYMDVISNYVEENVLNETEREFDQTVVYGKDVDLMNIVGLAKQFPMMGEKTVVIIKEAQNLLELTKKAAEDGKEKDKEPSPGVLQFISYIQQPQPSTILVFCFKYKTPDKRSAVVKALQKHAVFLETKSLYDNKIPEWVVNYVQDKHYSIGPKASFLLAEFLGNDLSKIANEIDKLLIGLPQGKEITAEKVQDIIGVSKDFNVFELQDAFTRKDILKANRIIQHFAANPKENPAPLIIASLYGFFSKVLKYQFLPDKSKFSASSALGINPYFFDAYSKTASVYSSAKLKHIFSHLKECDLKTKGVNNDEVSYGELLKELVYKIMH